MPRATIKQPSRWFLHWWHKTAYDETQTPNNNLSSSDVTGPDPVQEFIFQEIIAEQVKCPDSGEGDNQIVRLFGTYTPDLQALGAWLQAHQIRTVAMESTGVYWIPIFEYLESIGLQCCLISSRSIKRVPGRKSDVADCQWIQTLHSYGLLESSLQPDADLLALRTLLRHRAQLLQHRAPHILHMQKALLQTCAELVEA